MSFTRRRVGDNEFLAHYDEVASTQDTARTLYKSGETSIIGVKTDFQSKGRGRSGAAWVAPAGSCLLVTYILPLADMSRATRLGMTAALAVARTIDSMCGLAARLKWPNDVLLNGRKTAGILVETATRGESECAALVGIGVNLNVESFPRELEQSATSVRIEGRRETSITAFENQLRALLRGMAGELDADGWQEIISAWRNIDQSAGRRFRAATESGAVEGTAVRIAESGSLTLRVDDGTEIETVSATSI